MDLLTVDRRPGIGANRKTIFGLTVSEGMRPILVGVVVCVAGSLALTQFLAGLLFEVKPADVTSLLSQKSVM